MLNRIVIGLFMNSFFSVKIIPLFITFVFIFPFDVFSGVFSKKLILNKKQEELIDGSAASQTYIFNLEGDKAFLKIKSWHSMYSCDGSYIAKNINGIILLSWNASANGKIYFCDSPSPQFKIKMENNKFYLNGQLLDDGNEWYLMTVK